MVIAVNFEKYMAEPMAAGRVVKLRDGRIGVIDVVATNEIGGVVARRAYVVGIEKEFAVWVTRFGIAVWYGGRNGVTVSASRTPAPTA